MDLPHNLIEQVNQGRVVIVLGAGASFDAKNSLGEKPPSGAGLRDLLANKFLGGAFKDADLSIVAGYACTEQSIIDVQAYIKDIFEGFEPSEAHRLLGNFQWAGIATTNYDLLVEKAYSSSTSCLQLPVPRVENGDRIIELQRDPRSVIYLKLHGCITRSTNDQIPLILTKSLSEK